MGTLLEDEVATLALTGTDQDVSDTLTFVLVSDGSNGAAVINPSTGVMTYTPNADHGGNDVVKYAVRDSFAPPAASATATITLTILPVNDAPVAVPSSATVPEDSTLRAPLTCTDIDSDVFTFTITGDTQFGNIAIAGSGYTYTPFADYNGNDEFTFRCSDGELDSNDSDVDITVTPTNDRPPAVGASLTLDSATPTGSATYIPPT